MKILLTFFVFALWGSNFALALMDTRNGNFSDTWIDLRVPSSGYDLQVKRSYSSRSLFNGTYGFGWCSELESTVEVTPEGNLRLTECGGGLELLFKQKGFDYKKTKELVRKIIAGVKKKNSALKEDYYKKLRSKLEYDSGLREEFAKQLDIQGRLGNGKVFYADGRKNERIELNGKFYLRIMPNGTREKYDLKLGQLKAIYDKNGNYINITHKGQKIESVADNRGNKLQFHYPKGGGDKVSLITGPNGLSVSYTHKDEDLVLVKNAWKNTYAYKYDDLHNLVRIGFPDKTEKLIAYNKDKDWALSFTDRRKCKESYKYDIDKDDPLNHYTTHVEKKCNDKVTNISSYEFLYKIRKDSSRYLARTRSDNNGDITDVHYHPLFGKPTLAIKNNVRTAFEYYGPKHKLAGLLKKRIQDHQSFVFKYKNSCQKVSQVVSRYYQFVRLPAGKKLNTKAKKTGASKKTSVAKAKVEKKLRRTVTSDFKYSKVKCNLVSGKNSLGQVANISNDQKGRIKAIKDQAGKIILIKYEERFGKPRLVTRPGLGSLSIVYKSDGSIDKVNSDEGPTVALQVASVFNNLLEIIAPLSLDLNV